MSIFRCLLYNVFNPFLFRFWHYAQSEQYSSTARTIHRHIIHNITKRKRSRRSFILPEMQTLDPYIAGKLSGPKPLTFYDNDARELIFADQEVTSRLWILS